MANKKKKKQAAKKAGYVNEKDVRAEKLTNWYMINLSFGVLAIIVLLILRKLYRTQSTLLYMQPAAWIMTAVFAAAAIVIFVLGKSGKIKNFSRARNYSIFMLFCALGGLWLALYNKLRIPLEKLVQAITRNPGQAVSSYWNIYLLMIAVVAYLIGAFIYYVIKLYKLR